MRIDVPVMATAGTQSQPLCRGALCFGVGSIWDGRKENDHLQDNPSRTASCLGMSLVSISLPSSEHLVWKKTKKNVYLLIDHLGGHLLFSPPPLFDTSWFWSLRAEEAWGGVRSASGTKLPYWHKNSLRLGCSDGRSKRGFCSSPEAFGQSSLMPQASGWPLGLWPRPWGPEGHRLSRFHVPLGTQPSWVWT